MITPEKKQTIKLVLAISALVLIITFVAIMMIKYEVEGETNMPYKLSKIVVIGNATGMEKEKAEEQEENKNAWDYDVYQTNIVQFYIDENKDVQKADDLLIKSVKIDNIQITKAPQKGIVKTYMPSSVAGTIFTYDEQSLVEEKLEYKGAVQSSTTNLQIGSKGGSAEICFCNTDIANYVSSDIKEEIVHDGTWIKKVGLSNEEISFSVSFDFTIETTKNKYKANVNLNLPTEELGDVKNCYLEITDMSDIIFKRVK